MSPPSSGSSKLSKKLERSRLQANRLCMLDKQCLVSREVLQVNVTVLVRIKYEFVLILLLRKEGSPYFRIVKNKYEEYDYKEF
jgi:hypothetical protein